MFCHHCGLLGHDIRHCESHFQLAKSGVEVEYQYGEWLKATGGRSQSPGKRHTEQTQKAGSAKEKTGDDAHELRQHGKSGEAAAKEVFEGNPSWAERQNPSEPRESGGVTDLPLQHSVINAELESRKEMIGVMEINGDNGKESNDVHGTVGVNALKCMDPNLMVATDAYKESIDGQGTAGINVSVKENMASTVEPMQNNQMDSYMQDGSDVPKPKSTWVRMKHVDRGPKEKESGEIQSVLRKRTAMEIRDKEGDMSIEAHGGKRGKMEVHNRYSDKISARVDDHPCREQ